MIKKLNIKNIEMALQELEAFQKPKVELEQYHTPPRTAAEILV
jgi:predicted RNA methylase